MVALAICYMAQQVVYRDDYAGDVQGCVVMSRLGHVRCLTPLKESNNEMHAI